MYVKMPFVLTKVGATFQKAMDIAFFKKIGESRLCIDFRNLKKASLKDNYSLPKMDHILQRVVGYKGISFLDGFSGYNQVLVHLDDQHKTTFTTP